MAAPNAIAPSSSPGRWRHGSESLFRLRRYISRTILPGLSPFATHDPTSRADLAIAHPIAGIDTVLAKEDPMEVLDLTRRRGLVVGIANEHSLAWSAAQHFRNAGADLALTYLNDKAKPFVEPLARQVSAPIFLPCNVSESGQLEAVFQAIKQI